MPVNKDAKFRFEILDECLRNTKKKWTKAALLYFVNRRLELSQGVGTSISLSQLRYDLDNMQTECGAPIEMYREGKNYYYKYTDPEFSIKMIPINQEDVNKLSDAVYILQQIKGFTIWEEMADIVHRLEQKYNFDASNDRPAISFAHEPAAKSIEYLEDIYHAIIRKNVLKISYHTFNANIARIWTIHPYLLKEYNHRWYLLGQCDEKKKLGIYALDRMEDIRVVNMAFIENTLNNSDDYFKDVIGITILPGVETEQIELLFSRHLAPYIETKPLHSSQISLARLSDGSIQIALNVRINPELVSMLLSYGKDVRVLHPQHLVEKIHNIAHELLKNYE